MILTRKAIKNALMHDLSLQATDWRRVRYKRLPIRFVDWFFRYRLEKKTAAN